MKYRVIVYLAILFTGIIQSCGEAQFFGFNDKKSGTPGSPQVDFPPTGHAPLPSDENPRPLSDLTVMILVDMTVKNVPSQRPGQSPGQNPGQSPVQNPVQGPAQIQLRDSSCERQERLLALVDEAANEQAQRRMVHIGLIPFAGEVLFNWVIEPVTPEEMKRHLQEEFICAGFYAAPDLKGAEETAKERLAGISGKVKLLVLNDGGVATLFVEDRE